MNGVGRGVIDHLREEGLNIIPFLTSNSTKQALIQNLQVAFEQEEIRVLKDEVLKNELLTLRRGGWHQVVFSMGHLGDSTRGPCAKHRGMTA